jgi:hypothetical protein
MSTLAMMEIPPKAWIDSATFSDATKLRFSHGEIIVLVGPNNAGKSAALRGLREKFNNSELQSDVISEISYTIEGSPRDYEAWLKRNAMPKVPSSTGVYSFLGNSISIENLPASFSPKGGLHLMSEFLCRSLNVDARLTATIPPGRVSLTSGERSHPIHFLEASDELEKRASSYFRKAFGQDLVVHRNAGSFVPLYCGKRPVPKPGQDRVSKDYVKEIEKLTPLHTQGDGMRSFAAILIEAFVLRFAITFVDEPEAFLHPPQTKLLGRSLAYGI